MGLFLTRDRNNTNVDIQANLIPAFPTCQWTRGASPISYGADTIVMGTAQAIALPQAADRPFLLQSGRLTVNQAANGFSGINIQMRFWDAQPTYVSAVDGGVYGVSVGGATNFARFGGTFEQFVDGATCRLWPDGMDCLHRLPAGITNAYVDIRLMGAPPGQIAASKVFTFMAKVLQY